MSFDTHQPRRVRLGADEISAGQWIRTPVVYVAGQRQLFVIEADEQNGRVVCLVPDDAGGVMRRDGEVVTITIRGEVVIAASGRPDRDPPLVSPPPAQANRGLMAE